jgi:hypothetical protein
MLITLLGFCQLISTSLLKIDHIVIAHLIAGAMFSQNPTGELDAKSLNHLLLLVLSFKCKRKSKLALKADQNTGSFYFLGGMSRNNLNPLH